MSGIRIGRVLASIRLIQPLLQGPQTYLTFLDPECPWRILKAGIA